MSELKLLPCAHCGAEALRDTNFGRKARSCPSCGISIRGDIDATDEELDAAWNRRPAENPTGRGECSHYWRAMQFKDGRPVLADYCRLCGAIGSRKDDEVIGYTRPPSLTDEEREAMEDAEHHAGVILEIAKARDGGSLRPIWKGLEDHANALVSALSRVTGTGVSHE